MTIMYYSGFSQNTISREKVCAYLNDSSSYEIKNHYSYYSNGQLKLAGKYFYVENQNILKGKWIKYFKNGNIKYITNFDDVIDSSLCHYKAYNRNGSLFLTKKYDYSKVKNFKVSKENEKFHLEKDNMSYTNIKVEKIIYFNDQVYTRQYFLGEKKVGIWKWYNIVTKEIIKTKDYTENEID